MTIAFIAAILRGAFCIEKSYADAQLPLIISLLEGNKIDFSYSENEASETVGPYAVDASGKKYFADIDAWSGKIIKSAFDKVPEGSSAVIPIIGPMMKYDYCGSPGTVSMANQIKEADSHKNINSKIFYIDSPGGMVDGLSTFANVIKNSKKPSVAFTSGMMASAAYFAGCSKEIIASEKTDIIGCIGTMSQIVDFSEFYKEKKIKVKDIYAPQSVKKNEDMREFQEKGTTTLYENSYLKPMAQDFIDFVKQERGSKLSDDPAILQGRSYVAELALQKGMIDAIGNFDYAVSRAQALAREKEKFTLKFNS